jgi:hypothetical protein
MQKNYIQIECDIIEWGLQNDAKKMQTNAMWLHLMWFVKLVMQQDLNKMDVIF